MWETVINSLQDSGPALVLFTLAVLLGNVFGIWVWGYVHRRDLQRVDERLQQETRDKEYWRDKALVALGLGEEAVGIASDLAEEST